MSRLIQEIQQMHLEVTANQKKKLEDSTEYYWADEQAILDVLQPVLEKENAYLLWSLDSIEGNNVVALSLYEKDQVALTRATIIGETRNNNEFTARCTTIRRDMLSMMFMIRTTIPNVNEDKGKDIGTTPVANEKTVFDQILKKITDSKTNDALMVLKDTISKSKKLLAEEKMKLFDIIAEKMENGDTIE